MKDVKRAEQAVVYRNPRGQQVSPELLSATDAKNEFGKVLDTVMQGGIVVVTKHDAPKAVIISIEHFNALSSGTRRSLDALTAEFDSLLEGMQTPAARAGMKAAFGASSKELGRAAVTAARRA